MIQEVLTSKGTNAITSDHWHVVHSRFTGVQQTLPFARVVFSEHHDRATCTKVAKALRTSLALDNANVRAKDRDEVFVRKPNFKSLKVAQRRSVVTE